MQFPYSILSNSNPILKGLYQSHHDQGQDFPPPAHSYWIETASGDQMFTPNGDKYIFVED